MNNETHIKMMTEVINFLNQPLHRRHFPTVISELTREREELKKRDQEYSEWEKDRAELRDHLENGGLTTPLEIPAEVPVEAPAEIPAEVPVEAPAEIPADFEDTDEAVEVPTEPETEVKPDASRRRQARKR